MWGGQAEDTLEELVWRKGSCLDAQRRSLDDQGLEAERRGQLAGVQSLGQASPDTICPPINHSRRAVGYESEGLRS